MLLAPAFAALVIAVSPSADVSPSLVDRLVDEANTIWTPAGVTLVRHGAGSEAAASIEVRIGDERGAVHRYDAPLGWIEFNDGGPQSRLYLSYANAMSLLESAHGSIGVASRMPILERDTYLSRALGRALAHEVGHYLLSTRTHTEKGLMKANFTAAEFFSPDAHRFEISLAQRAAIATRLEHVPLVASTTSGSSSPRSPRPASTPKGTARWPGPIQD